MSEPNEYDDAALAYVNRNNAGNFAAVRQVPPEAAVTAIQSAPDAGVPASVGMRDPQSVADMARQQQQQRLVQTSPSVRQWTATAPPEHLAATQHDLTSLDRISRIIHQTDTSQMHGPQKLAVQIDNYLNKLGPIGDIADALSGSIDAGRAATKERDAAIARGDIGGGFKAYFHSGLALGSAISSPFASVTEPLAHAFSFIPAKQTLPLFPWEAPRPITTDAERLQEARNTVGLAFLGLGPEGKFAGLGPEAPKGPLFAKTGPAPVPGPDGAFHLDPEGYALDPSGKPAVYGTAREAGQAAVSMTSADRAFTHAVHPTENGFTVQDIQAQLARGNPLAGRAGTAYDPFAPQGVNPTTDAVRAATAELDAAHMEQVQKSVAASQTLTRSPTSMEAFLEQQTPGALARVDPDKLLELAANGHEVFPDQANAILRASIDGQPFTVPMSQYLTATSGKPFAADLNAATNFRENGVSVEDAKETAQSGVSVPAGKADVPADFTDAETGRAKVLAEEGRGAVERAFKAQLLDPLDAKALGLSKDELSRYSAKIEDAVQAASDRMLKRTYELIQRERAPDFLEAVKRHSAEVEQELAGRRDLVAQHALLRNKSPLDTPLETPAFKLSRKDTEAAYGKDVADKLPDRAYGKSGTHPDAVAEALDYSTGHELVDDLTHLERLQDLSGSKSPADYFKRITHAQAWNRAAAELGHDISPGAMYAEAQEMLSAPSVMDFLADELKVLADRAGIPFDKDAVKAYAKERFGELAVKDAINLKAREGYVFKAGNKAQKALLKGDYPSAFRWRQVQYMQKLQLAEAHKFLREYTKATKQFARLGTKPARPGMDQSFLDHIHATLLKVGLPVKRNVVELTQALNGKTLPDFVAPYEDAGHPIVWAETEPTLPKDKSVNDFRALADTIQSLAHVGREIKSVEVARKREEFDALMEEVKTNADTLGRKITPNMMEGKTLSNRAGKLKRGLLAPTIRMEQLLDEADLDNPSGPLSRSVTEPMQAAKAKENDLLAWATKEMKAFGKTQPKNWLASARTKINVPELLDDRGLPRITTKGQLIRAALNWGNEANAAKLLEGYDWTREAVQSAFDQHLTKADWDFVQKVWDMHETVRPEIERTYRELSGVAPTWIEPVPVATPYGIYAGGYYPLVKDGLRATDNAGRLSDKSIFGEDYSSALPANPYTKGRTDATYPLSLSFDSIINGLAQTIHDISFRKALLQANKVLSHPTVRRGIQDNFGEAFSKQLRPWMEYIARERVTDDTSTEWLSNFLRERRSNITFVGLAYRFSSALIHGSVALSDSIAEVGVLNFAGAMAEIYRTPGQFKQWSKFISENSPEVRHRMVNMDRDIRDAVRGLAEKQGFLSTAQSFGYHMLAASDQFSALPTWLAAYKDGIAKSLAPEEAMRLADKRVRQAHGASSPVDIPALLRGGHGAFGELGRFFTAFLSFQNHALNRFWRIGRQFSRAGEQASAGEWAGATRDFGSAAGRSLGYILLPAVAIGLIRSWQHGELSWDAFTSGLAHTTIGAFPGANIALGLIEHDEAQMPLERMAKETKDTTKNAINAATGHPDKVGKRWLSEAVDTAGYWAKGIPGQAGTTGQYLWDFSSGAEPNQSIADVFRGILFGPKPKPRKKP